MNTRTRLASIIIVIVVALIALVGGAPSPAQADDFDPPAYCGPHWKPDYGNGVFNANQPGPTTYSVQPSWNNQIDGYRYITVPLNQATMSDAINVSVSPTNTVQIPAGATHYQIHVTAPSPLPAECVPPPDTTTTTEPEPETTTTTTLPPGTTTTIPPPDTTTTTEPETSTTSTVPETTSTTTEPGTTTTTVPPGTTTTTTVKPAEPTAHIIPQAICTDFGWEARFTVVADEAAGYTHWDVNYSGARPVTENFHFRYGVPQGEIEFAAIVTWSPDGPVDVVVDQLALQEPDCTPPPTVTPPPAKPPAVTPPTCVPRTRADGSIVTCKLPATGDNENLIWWLTALGVAGVCVGGLLLFARRHRRS